MRIIKDCGWLPLKSKAVAVRGQQWLLHPLKIILSSLSLLPEFLCFFSEAAANVKGIRSFCGYYINHRHRSMGQGSLSS